jgi:hypothetical protein
MAVCLDYLSAGVPPRRLLAAAARRAWRSVGLRLRPAPTFPSRAELLAGLRCATLERVTELLRAPRRGLAARGRGDLRAGLTALPGELELAAARAERALAGRLSVFGQIVDVRRPGGGTDWQADLLHGGRFAAGAASDDLPAVPGADIKMAWAVGRGEHWVALGCGAIASPDRAGRFAEAYASSLRDFVAENPVGRGAQWASPMEASLRAVCAAQAHALLWREPALGDPAYALDLCRLVVGTARFVLARLEDAQVVPNNHLAANWVGLLACAVLLPEWPEASRWRLLARAGLAREITAQTHVDGTSFEGSVPYHRLALEIFTVGALLCEAARVPLGRAQWRRIGAMYGAARALLSCAGELPQIGDHDSGRALAFRERRPLDAGYLLPLGAAVTGEPGLLVRAGLGDAVEALWVCGGDALERLARARAGPAPGSASFPQGGFHVLRRGAIEVAVSCGRNGQSGIGGHSHNDKLAFELRLGGRLLVCDPGSPSYTGDPALRDRFRGTRAHATISVDGEEQARIPPRRPFALPDGTSARLLAFEPGAGRERLVGEHRGYARLGVVHRREIVLLDSAVVVVDRLEGTGVHAIELRFPFPSREARLRRASPRERRRIGAAGAEGWNFARAVVVGPASAPLAVLVAASPSPLEVYLEDSAYSPGYGEIEPARSAVFSARFTCPASVVSAILCRPAATLESRESG